MPHGTDQSHIVYPVFYINQKSGLVAETYVNGEGQGIADVIQNNSALPFVVNPLTIDNILVNDKTPGVTAQPVSNPAAIASLMDINTQITAQNQKFFTDLKTSLVALNDELLSSAVADGPPITKDFPDGIPDTNFIRRPSPGSTIVPGPVLGPVNPVNLRSNIPKIDLSKFPNLGELLGNIPLPSSSGPSGPSNNWALIGVIGFAAIVFGSIGALAAKGKIKK